MEFRGLRRSSLSHAAGDKVIGRRVTRVLAAALTLLGCFWLGTTSAAATPGDLDPNFSGDGKLVGYSAADYDLREPGFADVVLQGDGKIVSVGDYGLVRFNPDGARDASFVTDPPGTDPRSFAAVALQPDGKIVVAGHEYNYATDDSDFFVARYNPGGSRDNTFSGDGILTMDFGGHDDRAEALVVQPDGKIVAAGYSVELDTDDVPSRDFALARYDPDGTLDASFSGDGKRTTDFADDTAHDIALQPDGKIVVGGSASGDIAVVRYDEDGSLDSSFSGDGRATAGFTDARGDGGRAVAIQPDGKIVAAGGTSGDFALARFDADGLLDATFGGEGVVTTDFGVTDRYERGAAARDVVFQSDRLLAAGYATRDFNRDFALARYELDGDLDAGFSGDGMLATEMGYGDSASSIAVQPDGRVVVGGSAEYNDGISIAESYGALARYLSSAGPPDADADGLLDPIDLCPQIFAPEKSDGCPRYRRSVSLDLGRYGGERIFSGYLTGGCLQKSRVRVFKIKPGGRKVKVAGGTPDYDGHFGEWSYGIPTNRTRGRYVAKLRRQLQPDVGWCSAARSDVLRLPRHR
ncbi:MAG TPA: hypothetical protein VN458_13395 [Solirubrobacterales bacterium]|nr:hypothetical protein [Solirubrobacterales bacterium]